MLEDAEGKVRLCDFGLSQFFQARPERLESGKMIKLKHQGVRFIPPEMIEDYLLGKFHLRDIEAHKKADIWAAGTTLYRLLTREFPIKATSLMNLKTQLRSSEPVNLELID